MVNAGKHSRGCISGNPHTFGVYLDSKRLDLERWPRVSQKSCSRNSMSLRRFSRVFTLEEIISLIDISSRRRALRPVRTYRGAIFPSRSTN